jgi:hypothetical protein
MREITVTQVERCNLAIFILGSIAIAVFVRDLMTFFSFAVASAIVILNFRLLKNIITKLVLKQEISKKDLFLTLPAKFFLLLGILGVIVVYGNIKLFYFLMGLSTVFVSILVSQLLPVFSSSSQRRQDNGA